MELEVPKRVIFRGTLSTVMVQQDAVREAKEVLSMQKSRDRGIERMLLLFI